MQHARTYRAAVALILLAAALLAGCGNKKKTETEGKTEGVYLDVGPLIYQVQISRQLNPRNVEDRTYLSGLPRNQRKLGRDEVWFGVFLRVQNNTDDPAPSASEFRVLDTEEKAYTPVSQTSINPFAYRPTVVPAGQVLPRPGSAASTGPIQAGSLLLFKLTTESLANRPLELQITSPTGEPREGTVELDV